MDIFGKTEQISDFQNPAVIQDSLAPHPPEDLMLGGPDDEDVDVGLVVPAGFDDAVKDSVRLRRELGALS